jgi:hypothetical protein
MGFVTSAASTTAVGSGNDGARMRTPISGAHALSSRPNRLTIRTEFLEHILGILAIYGLFCNSNWLKLSAFGVTELTNEISIRVELFVLQRRVETIEKLTKSR